ncbi:AAA family ATPase [Candidatus Woesearchaeota archaeon]|nr:AAA family ATPase [Candidatus Woesearchaeota archaeon]
MTTIKSISAKGFKSFAKKTELLFGNNYNCIIGPNGSGKSLSKNSVVTLSNGLEIKIGDLVEKKLKESKSIENLDDGVYCEGKDVSVLSINPITMKLEEKEVSKFVKRKGEVLFEIKTRSGKEVKTTGCHPVMIFKNGGLRSTLVRDLKEGEVIVTPRRVYTNPKNKFNDEKARLLGYLIGDGTIRPKYVRFVNQDNRIVEDILDIVKKHFNTSSKNNRYRRNPEVIDLIWWDKGLINWLQGLFNNENNNEKLDSSNKYVPNEILSADLSSISNFLAGLFDTDGSIRKNPAVVEYCSKNKILTDQVQRLLLRFGINSRVKERIGYAYSTEKKIKRPYYYLYIYGYENIKNFYINIPLKCSHKKVLLEGIIKNKVVSNPNIDVLPREINELIKRAVNLLGIKIKNNRKNYPRLAAYIEDRCCPTREGLNEILPLLSDKLLTIYSTGLELKKNQLNLIETMDMLHISGRKASLSMGLSKQIVRDYWATGKFKPRTENLDAFFDFIQSSIRSRLQELEFVMNSLCYLANSDVFWDEVIEIKKCKEEDYVYDLTIPDNHNFIANGLIVHNSNIADLITFVLGKSSAKSMRAEKSANLIYNGGKNSNPYKEAEATIVFDNSDSIFSLKDKNISVSRIIRQSGNSLYKINGKKMTRQQVLDFLNSAHIDPDGHNIVLQGDIVRFMEMRPEERREIIEEISGISVYQEKKQKAMRELEKFQFKLGEIEIIMTERNAHLRELKNERDQAVRYRELETLVKRSKATLIDLEIKRKNDELVKLETDVKKHNDYKKSIEERINSLVKEIGDRKKEIESINENIERKGEKEQVELHREVETMKEELIMKTNRFDTLKNELSRIINRKKQLKLDRDELEKRINETKGMISKLESEKIDIRKQEEVLIKSRKDDHDDSLEGSIERKQELFYSTKEKEQQILREVDKATYLLEEIEKKFGASSGGNPGDITGLKKEFKKVAEELNKKLNDDSMYSSQLGKARREIVEKNEQLATLRARDVGRREVTAADFSVKQILKSGIKGIHNTVGDLGEANKKYSMALEVAAGSRINGVVVEDDQIASTCIKYLKDKKMGIVAFLPLNKMRTIDIPSIKKGNGVHGPALELIKFDPRFKNVFSYVFGNTLVVDNVEVARKVGIGKVRMVTLEGDLMEPSGAMIGGYRKRRQGAGFKEKDISEEIIKLESQVSELQNKIDVLDKNRSENEVGIIKLREVKTNLEIDIMKIEKTSGVVDMDKLNKEKKELSSKLSILNKELENVQDDVKSLARELTLLKEKKQKELTEKGMSSTEAKRTSIRERLASLESDVKNMKSQLDTMLIPEYDKIGKIMKDHDKETEEFTSEMKTVDAYLKENRVKLREKENKEKKFYSEFKDLFNKRNKLQDQLGQRETTLAREEERLNSLNSKFNTFSIEKARLIAETEELNKEFEPFLNVKLRKGISFEDLRGDIKSNEKDLEKFGNVNLKALEAYESLEKEYKILEEKADTLKQEKEDVISMMHEIESKKKDLFMKTYSSIEKNFKEIFNRLTTKGQAHMELEDKEDPFNGGLDIKVRITGNKYLDIKGLSGGEKTMAALAFIFSIQEYKPASFYLMDEVDAALDKTNSTKLSKLIEQYSKKAQYIVISHNDAVISEADQIYGVSMKEGVSKIVSLKI